MKKTTVGITNCYSYEKDEVYKAVEKACSVCTFPNVQGKTVLVKPNILSDSEAKNCITTHPEVVRSVIRLLKEKGASTVYCGDSQGLHNKSFCGKKCGIFDICQEEGAIWSDFTESPEVTEIKGTNQKIPMAKIVKEVDCVISVCKFKTHQLMYTTGAVKNLFGTIPSIDKAACHVKNPSRKSFAKLIVGICETVKPAFCIMDAVIGMEGPGPANGYPRPLNLILASDSCYAMDEAEALIMGYNPGDIPVLAEAKKRHLLPDAIEYPLLNAKELEIKDFKRITITKKTNMFMDLILPFITRNLKKKRKQKDPAPTFLQEKCIGCKRCINICPAKALTMEEKNKVIIDTEKCIRCYCCHEMCPVAAIEIKGENNE